MSDRLTFSIPGLPRGKERPRGIPSLIWREGEPEAIVRFVTPAATVAAEAAARAAFQQRFPMHRLWTGPVMIRFTAVFPVPDSWSAKMRRAALTGMLHTSKPDKDNIEKLICDALKGVAWHDDSQCHGGGTKRYGTHPRVDVTLEHVAQPDLPVLPAQKRRDAPPVPKGRKPTETAPRGNPPKSGNGGRRYDAKTQALIDAALARDASQ